MTAAIAVIGWARMRFAAASVIVCAIVFVLYARVGLPYLNELEQGGEYYGPMSAPILMLKDIIPLVLGALLLMGVVYGLIIAPIQRERATNVQRRPPR